MRSRIRAERNRVLHAPDHLSCHTDPMPTPVALPPGTRLAPLQSLLYMRDPYGYYERNRARFGDLFTIPTLNGTLVVTLRPEGAREILTAPPDTFVTGFGVDALIPFVGRNSLFAISGERHRKERKLLSPPFHGRRLRGYQETAREATLREIATWTPGGRVELLAAMQRLTLDVVIQAVFGVHEEDHVAAFRTAVRNAVSEVNPLPIFFKFLQNEFGGIGPWARFRRHLALLDQLIYDQIETTRRGAGDGEDVLSGLLRAGYEDGSALDDECIRDHLLTLLVAGHETTATALTWALYEALHCPAAGQRLLDEVAALGPDPEPHALADSDYLDAFCREALRLHPIVPEFFRTVKQRFVFGGYEIPAGISVAASILALHRDPSLYPEPLAFRPERFLEARFAPHEFAAFGGGFRHCVGAAFALTEMKIALGTLLPRLALSLADPAPPRTVFRSVILAPEGGVPVHVARRDARSPARAA